MRAGPALALLALSLLTGCARTPERFELALKDRFAGYLTQQTDNPAAQELAAFWAASPEWTFKVAPGGGREAVRALPAKKQIQISSSTLAEAGLDPAGPDSEPAAVDAFLSRAGPFLFRELVRARTWKELNYKGTGLLEDQLLAEAYMAWFIANQPGLATRPCYDLGVWGSDEYAQLMVRTAREERRRAEALAKAASVPRDESPEERDARNLELDESAASVAAARDALHQAVQDHAGGDALHLQQCTAWAEFALGWTKLQDQVRAVSDAHSLYDAPRKLEEDLTAKKIRLGQMKKELLGQVFQDARQDALFSEDWNEAAGDLGFWESAPLQEQARRYFKERLDAVKIHAGRGFNPASPEEARPAAKAL